ncbi:MAG TPA: phosphatase PAP2 family protein [Chloroflexi bacterium]|mgnify:CR=1 FL=1|jgi:undecaprenyl-diphosphatase|nr:phosphatase PAP2 family protein [Chloroflexota bacterium]
MTLKSILAWDQHWTSRLHLSRDSGLAWRLAAVLAHSGDSWFWLPGLGLIWLFSRGEWHARAAIMAVGVFALAVLVMLIKFTVKRARPDGDWGAVYRQTDPHSFPSGHAARAFLLLILAWALGPSWLAVALTLWAPLVALSRVVTRMHYLSDVLAGALLGVVFSAVVLALVPLLMRFFPFLF